MKVTISDIAKIAKCSVSTVSKALSDSSDLNVKTKEEILKYAVELGYNFSRKKANAKGKIAAFVQSTKVDTIRFEYQMLFNFNLVAGRNGYDVEIIQKNTSDHLWEYRHETEGKDYAGVFLLRTSDIERVREDIMKSSLPIVAFDQEFDRENAASVGCDNACGIKLAVQHLVALGHKKIAFYGGSPTALVSIERKKSFILSMRANDIPVYPELIAESNFSQNFAPYIIPDFIENGATAIVCASDLLAKYAVDEIVRNGLSVPNDISVVGFDNVPIAEEVGLTTVNQNIAEIGKSAFYLLQNLINGVPVNRLTFRPRLVVRQSTSKLLP